MKAILLLAALAASCAPLPADPPKRGWQPIFDGKSLDGWTPKIAGYPVGEDPRHIFTVKDGALRAAHDGYDKFEGQFAHIFWKTPVSAFRIRFEYRIFGKMLPGGQPWQHSNSGLMFFSQAPETMTRDQQFPVSLEAQLLGADRPTPEPSGNLCTPGTNVLIDGKPAVRHCTLSSSPILPNGRWIRAEVEVARDGTITHFIDGQQVLRYSAPQLDPNDPLAKPVIERAGGRIALTGGYLALQGEGHPVEFRNIELMSLD
jgi:hypothetical protein